MFVLIIIYCKGLDTVVLMNCERFKFNLFMLDELMKVCRFKYNHVSVLQVVDESL